MKKLLSGLCVILLSGCASIIDGKSQVMMVNTSPDGATCSAIRNDEKVTTFGPTPSTFSLDKTKYDLTIECEKVGYNKTTYVAKSGIDDWTWGNILFGGLIGWGIDSARGADNYYDTPVTITLEKK